MDLEKEVNRILTDPQSMQTIMQLAQSLGAPSGDTTEQDAAESPPIPTGKLLHILQTVQQAGQRDPQQQALLEALRPYVTAAHCQRLDRAMQMAQLSKLAGFALQDDAHT